MINNNQSFIPNLSRIYFTFICPTCITSNLISWIHTGHSTVFQPFSHALLPLYNFQEITFHHLNIVDYRPSRQKKKKKKSKHNTSRMRSEKRVALGQSKIHRLDAILLSSLALYYACHRVRPCQRVSADALLAQIGRRFVWERVCFS